MVRNMSKPLEGMLLKFMSPPYEPRGLLKNSFMTTREAKGDKCSLEERKEISLTNEMTIFVEDLERVLFEEYNFKVAPSEDHKEKFAFDLVSILDSYFRTPISEMKFASRTSYNKNSSKLSIITKKANDVLEFLKKEEDKFKGIQLSGNDKLKGQSIEQLSKVVSTAINSLNDRFDYNEGVAKKFSKMIKREERLSPEIYFLIKLYRLFTTWDLMEGMNVYKSSRGEISKQSTIDVTRYGGSAMRLLRVDSKKEEPKTKASIEKLIVLVFLTLKQGPPIGLQTVKDQIGRVKKIKEGIYTFS